MVFLIVFYSTDEVGERLLLGVRPEPTRSIERARNRAANLMRQLVFTEGRANHWVIRDEDGNRCEPQDVGAQVGAKKTLTFTLKADRTCS